MKEVPFVQHHPLISLPPKNGQCGGGGAVVGGTKNNGVTNNDKARRVYIASVNHGVATGGSGAIGVTLTQANANNAASSSTALVPTDLSQNGNNASRSSSSPTTIPMDAQEEAYALRGLSSIHHDQKDNRIICTNGVAGRRGVVRVSIRDAGGTPSGATDGKEENAVQDVEVDLSSIMDEKVNASSLFEGPIVGTSVFVTHSSNDEASGTEGDDMDMPSPQQSHLHVRTVDPYGTILSLTFSYPTMTPYPTSSFLLPLSPHHGTGQHDLRPHPGSLIENCNQVCFPTPWTVVFALNPHLYCVDLQNNLGDDNTGHYGQAVTRVWTSIYNVTSDPITDHSLDANTASARKKPRKSLGSILTKATYSLMGIDDSNEEGYEYAEDGEDDGQRGSGVGGIPSIAALANLSCSNNGNGGDGKSGGIARVATLHSDGSLRIWTAEPSRKESPAQLRIPSVQRIAISDKSSSWSSSEYINPSIPHPSLWDPCRDALTLRGKYTVDAMKGGLYEVALHVQVYSNGIANRNKEENTGSLYVFQGEIVSAAGNDDTKALPAGDTANMQTLLLPNGARSVVDVAWSAKRDLMVLLRHGSTNGDGNNETETFYDIGEEDRDAKVTLALYPLDYDKGSYCSDAVSPSNVTLAYLDFNHFGYSFGLSVEEELDRYMTLSGGQNNDDKDGHSEDMDANPSSAPSNSTSAATTIAKAEAQVDRAGLRAILQPFGRSRPSALAVHRAMSTLGLLDNGDDRLENEVRPVDILSAMHKWKKRAAFQSSSCTSSSSALVAVVDNENGRSGAISSPMASDSLSIYHAFASANKSSTKRNNTPRLDNLYNNGQKGNDSAENNKNKSKVNDVEAAQQAHRWRWIQLLSGIRIRESQLDEVLCFEEMSINNNSSGDTFLVRGSMTSVLVLNDEDVLTAISAALSHQEGEVMAALDDLSMDLLQCITSNPDLRQLLTKVESMLYDGTSKASSLVDEWYDNSDIELLSQVELLGSSAMMRLSLTDGQLGLLGELSQLDPNVAEAWLKSPSSASSPICTSLAISKPSATMPNSAAIQQGAGDESDALSSAASLISAKLESIRQLSLSRLILVFGSPQGNPPPIQHGALRSILYSTALSWAIHQPSSVGNSMTVLEEHLSHEMRKVHSGMTAALSLADMVVSSAFSHDANATSGGVLSNLVSPSHEPQVALRLLAPLAEFPSAAGPSDTTSSVITQKSREVTAECLLAEAAIIAKSSGSSSANGTSPEALWRLASNLLLDTETLESTTGTMSNLMNRIGTLERHLNSIEGSNTSLPLCCGVILDAIRDAISTISSNFASPEIPTLLEIAFQTSMRGHLWNEALHACVSNPLSDRRNANLKRLILGMVDAGALGKIVDMSLTVMGRELSTSMQEDHQDGDTDGTVTGIDLFDLASKIIEEAAVEQVSVPLESEARDAESALKDRPNYWGCLYALHASRGNWRHAAYAMDMCGKATADSVSSSKSDSQTPLVLSKAASRKIMDDACLSAQACFHAINLVDKPSHRYLLPGSQDIPSESRLFTKEDLERRAARALALRTFSMDDYSPDSVGSILELTSRDTIDSLARFGYYDQAITVALGISSKRKALPGGVDLFDDALRYILCTYLVPAATKTHATIDDGDLESLQSRSKIAQISASSSACALGSADTPPQSRITSFSINSKSWVSNDQSGKVLQSTMAMDLLQQYTSVYYKRCSGLCLSVANAILRVGDSVSELPLWLKDLCMFGTSGDEESKNGLFAQPAGKDNDIANPAGLMRLYIKHHQYGEACDVVTSILSKQTSLSSNASSRLPEKGSIDYVPYDLIDMLWNMIDSIVVSNSSNSSEDVKSQVKSLTKRRNCMEQALDKHFELLKMSEEGLISARGLSRA